jgi:hypothetical protein
MPAIGDFSHRASLPSASLPSYRVTLTKPRRLLAVASNLKVRTLLSLGYGCGLRASEVVRLKVKHIDSAQKIIRVEQSKGRKDRNVMLSPETLGLLRQWWKARRSRYDAATPVAERWLFPGNRRGKPPDPYRLVAQQPGTKLEFEDGYYRPVHIKNFTIINVPGPATRVAMLERGETDIVYFIPGEMVARVQSNPNIMLAPVVSGNWWLAFPGFQDPQNPFHDKRVREAVSLAIDREAMNQAECAGLGQVDGNWINDDVENALDWPKWPRNVAKAKQLMAEAGYPNGFTYDWLTPAPPYYSRGERILSQLQTTLGIRGKMQPRAGGLPEAATGRNEGVARG